MNNKTRFVLSMPNNCVCNSEYNEFVLGCIDDEPASHMKDICGGVRVALRFPGNATQLACDLSCMLNPFVCNYSRTYSFVILMAE